jgi:hypothetical protein
MASSGVEGRKTEKQKSDGDAVLVTVIVALVVVDFVEVVVYGTAFLIAGSEEHMIS